MSALTDKPLKGLKSLAPMLHTKEQSCINNSRDDLHIIGKEKDRCLIRLKESIFINHIKTSLSTKEDNADLRNYLINCRGNKLNVAGFVLCV